MIIYNKITWSPKNKRDNKYEKCPRVKLVGDWKITGLQWIFLQQQKHSYLKRDTPQKEIDEQLTSMIICDFAHYFTFKQ